MLKPHPTAPLKSLLFPRPQAATIRLLQTPGLELTFNARGALLAAFSEIAAKGGRKVLVPAFHCPSAISPVLLAGLEPVFYRIKRDLTIDYMDLLSMVDPSVSAVLVIHFMGLIPNLAPLATLQRTGVVIVEDCSHSFFEINPIRLTGHPGSDYRIYSFWKILPCGVGGGLLRSVSVLRAGAHPARGQAPLKQRLRNYKHLMEASIEHSGFSAMLAPMRLLESIRNRLRKPRRLPDIDRAAILRGEDYYPVEPELMHSTIPAYVIKIMENSDLEAVARQRRLNYARFSAQAGLLGAMQPLAPPLSAHSCPWVFPVLLKGRDGIDRKLKTAGVQLHTFGLYLHSALFDKGDARTVADAQFLAEHVLCLSVHQDLTEDNIDQAVHTIQHEIGIPA